MKISLLQLAVRFTRRKTKHILDNTKHGQNMALKTFIAFIFLASFVHNNESILLNPLLWGQQIFPNNVQNHLLTRDIHYMCPKYPKTLYVGTSLSVDQAITDSANKGTTEKSLYAMSPRLFMRKRGPRETNNLDMTVLPSNEVCVLGKKLKNVILPQNYQSQIMTGIAIWLSPCTLHPYFTIHEKSNECIERRLKAIELVDIDVFRRLYFTVRAVMHI